MALNFFGRDRTTPIRVASAHAGIAASALFRSAHAFLTRHAPLTSKKRNELPRRRFAYVDSKGGEHLPIHDKAHAIRARGRFNQTYFESEAKAREAWDKILAAEKRFGIKSNGDDEMPAPRIRPVPTIDGQELGQHRDGWNGVRAASAAHEIGTFAFALEARREGGVAPEWITLIPAGEFRGVDGRGPYKLDKPERVTAATQAMLATHMTAGMPLDFDHATDFAAPEGRPAPAAGWIKQVRAVNGALQGRIEWTANGAAAVAEHEYRYVSPVFEYDDDGSVIRLLRAALTNNPNLNLPAISSADRKSLRVDPSTEPALSEAEGAASEQPNSLDPICRTARDDNQFGDEDMEFTAAEIRLIALMAKKGMPLHETVKALSAALPHAHPHKILDMAKLAVNPEARDAAEGDPNNDGDMHAGTEAADRDDGYDAESAENPYAGERSGRRRAGNARSELMTELDAAVARHPMMISAQKAINDLRGERAKEKAERLVDEAMAAGKLIPAQRQWAVAYASAELAGFQKFIGTQVALKLDDKGSPIGIRQTPPAADDPNSLTQAELAICAHVRCTPKEYLERKTYNAARMTGLVAQAAMLRIEVASAA